MIQRRFTFFAWFVLAFNVAVVLWGAYVRATGSGAGCGEHWPLCNGQMLPRSPQLATIIEFTHRATSGVVLILIVILAALAFRSFPSGHVVRRAATWALLLTLSEALIGAGLVLLGHVAGNASTARGYSLSIHLVNTLFLLAALTVTAWHSSDHPPLESHPLPPRIRTAFLVSAGAFLLVGISGAVAALGDTLFRVSSLAEGIQRDFDPSAHPFVRLRILHPALAIFVAGALIVAALYLVSGSRGNRRTHRLAYTLITVTLAQIVLGALNLALMAPVWLQLVHLLTADLLWITLVLLAVEIRPLLREQDRLGSGQVVTA